MSSDAPLLVSHEGGVTVLQLNRPAQRNALVQEIKTALPGALDAFFNDPAQRCLLVAGVGDCFCAGGDVSSFGQKVPPDVNQRRIESTQNWARKLLTGAKPVVMAVNGPAVGAGFGLSMLGDIIIASQRAFFQPGFAGVGMCPDGLLGITLQRAVGAPRAREILLTNRKVAAEEAARLGLVSRVVADDALFDEAMNTARLLAEAPQPATGLTKTLLRAATDVDLDGYCKMEAAFQAIAMGSDDHAEGVAAFFEKRRPLFGKTS
jgi:2-(1,2-epoxy-1,2-dihydrophenyl)acetyl-CoA isomerase